MVHGNVDLQTPERERSPAAEPRNVEPAHGPDRGGSEVDFGVVVGIEHYAHAGSLRGAAGDAASFRAWLIDPQGGGLDPGNVQLIVSDDQQPVLEQPEIDEKLLLVLNAAYALGGARRLYFYFAGHGATCPPRSGDDVALLLTRWTRGLARLALSTARYSSTLRGTGAFEEMAVFIDCCRNPTVSAVGLPPTITLEWQALFASTRKFIAFASEAGQPAFETSRPPPDRRQGIAADRVQGIFTRRLLSILRQEPDGISARALKDRLEREVRIEAEELGLRQYASAENGFDEWSCFGRGGTLPQLELRFARRRGPVVLRGGDRQIVARHVADDAPWILALPVGLYRIEGGGEPDDYVDHDGRGAPRVV